MKTKRLVVDIPQTLHNKFTKAVDRHGLKKKKVIELMVEGWVVNNEANPHYFKWLEEQDHARSN